MSPAARALQAEAAARLRLGDTLDGVDVDTADRCAVIYLAGPDARDEYLEVPPGVSEAEAEAAVELLFAPFEPRAFAPRWVDALALALDAALREGAPIHGRAA